MDADRFDSLSRSLIAARSRRFTLGGLATGVLLALSLAPDEDMVLAKKKGKKKRKECPFGRRRCGNKCCLLEETCQRGQCKHRCEDGVQNAGESDTDCGRVCDGVLGTSPFGRCDLRKRCAGNDDCRSAKCREPQPGAELQCVECLQDTDCGSLRCLDNFCFPCAIDDDCPRPTIDAPEQRFCVVLTNFCPNNQPCVCRECRSDSDCPARTPHCVNNICVQCRSDSECPPGQTCEFDFCTNRCTDNLDCQSGVACENRSCTGTCEPQGACPTCANNPDVSCCGDLCNGVTCCDFGCTAEDTCAAGSR